MSDLETRVLVSWNEPLETALRVLAAGTVTVTQLQAADKIRQAKRPRIGTLAIERRLLTVKQVFRILEEQAGTRELFGETAIRLGMLSTADLSCLLELQVKLTPSLSAVLIEMGILKPESKPTAPVSGRSNRMALAARGSAPMPL